RAYIEAVCGEEALQFVARPSPTWSLSRCFGHGGQRAEEVVQVTEIMVNYVAACSHSLLSWHFSCQSQVSIRGTSAHGSVRPPVHLDVIIRSRQQQVTLGGRGSGSDGLASPATTENPSTRQLLTFQNMGQRTWQHSPNTPRIL